MTVIERSIDVRVPVAAAYRQWIQFDDYPHFLKNIEAVQYFDEHTLRWRARVGHKIQEWDVRIVAQTPGEQVTWKSITGAPSAGDARFQHISSYITRVVLRLDYQPASWVERLGDLFGIGIMGRMIDADLKRFKRYVEAHAARSGPRARSTSDVHVASHR